MIQVETITIRNKEYRRTYSDANKYIVNAAGEKYAEAVDPLDTEREYTETDEAIEEEANGSAD